MQTRTHPAPSVAVQCWVDNQGNERRITVLRDPNASDALEPVEARIERAFDQDTGISRIFYIRQRYPDGGTYRAILHFGVDADQPRSYLEHRVESPYGPILAPHVEVETVARMERLETNAMYALGARARIDQGILSGPGAVPDAVMNHTFAVMHDDGSLTASSARRKLRGHEMLAGPEDEMLHVPGNVEVAGPLPGAEPGRVDALWRAWVGDDGCERQVWHMEHRSPMYLESDTPQIAAGGSHTRFSPLSVGDSEISVEHRWCLYTDGSRRVQVLLHYGASTTEGVTVYSGDVPEGMTEHESRRLDALGNGFLRQKVGVGGRILTDRADEGTRRRVLQAEAASRPGRDLERRAVLTINSVMPMHM